MKASVPPLHCPCEGAWFVRQFVYDTPPPGEVRFGFTAAADYRREVRRCRLCGHFISVHTMHSARLYAGDYVSSTYGDDGIRAAFDRIVALDPARSDNEARVRRINEFAERHFGGRNVGRPRTALDVGSGLGVFVHRMKAEGWTCTALDPDLRSVRHARDVVGVAAVHADFRVVENLGHFDIVTFNKVLEHVEDPVALLARTHAFVEPDGFAYVEVPNGEAAAAEGPEREEFFIDHLHVFSPASLAFLVSRAGFSVAAIGCVHEPSTKYTLWAFAVPPGGPTCVSSEPDSASAESTRQ